MNNDDIYTEFEYEEEMLETRLKGFTLPPEADMAQYGMVLHILGPGGSIEEILFDVEEIYKYVRDVYKKCPKRN